MYRGAARKGGVLLGWRGQISPRLPAAQPRPAAVQRAGLVVGQRQPEWYGGDELPGGDGQGGRGHAAAGHITRVGSGT